MTCPSLPFALGLSVRPVLKPKGFEDTDGHYLPCEKDDGHGGREEMRCQQATRWRASATRSKRAAW
jgi:hypothetical protein